MKYNLSIMKPYLVLFLSGWVALKLLM